PRGERTAGNKRVLELCDVEPSARSTPNIGGNGRAARNRSRDIGQWSACTGRRRHAVAPSVDGGRIAFQVEAENAGRPACSVNSPRLWRKIWALAASNPCSPSPIFNRGDPCPGSQWVPLRKAVQHPLRALRIRRVAPLRERRQARRQNIARMECVYRGIG